jgi:hypothetical protein
MAAMLVGCTAGMPPSGTGVPPPVMPDVIVAATDQRS